jgi:hypothetical protein
MQMQPGLVEVDFSFAPLGKIAMLIIYCAFVALIYHLVVTLVRYKQLRRRAQILCQPLLVQLELEKWEPSAMSWPDIGAHQFSKIAQAFRRALQGVEPLAVIAALNQAVELLAGPILRVIGRLKVLAWSTGIVGGIGAISTLHGTLMDVTMREEFSPGAVFGGLYWVIVILLCGIVVSLSCLAVSNFTQNRLRFLYQNMSNEILFASVKKSA